MRPETLIQIDEELSEQLESTDSQLCSGAVMLTRYSDPEETIIVLRAGGTHKPLGVLAEEVLKGLMTSKVRIFNRLGDEEGADG